MSSKSLTRSKLHLFPVVGAFVMTPAQAASSPAPLDLVSLTWESDAIVRAERLERRGCSEAPTFAERCAVGTQYRVVHVYFGDIQPGLVIEIDEEIYRYQEEPPIGTQRGELRREAVLFLCEATLEAEDHPPPALVYTGLRVLMGDGVYRFNHGLSNPGPLFATPQERELTVTDEQTSDVELLTLADFEAELRIAIDRVQAVREALEIDDASERRRHILEALPPVQISRRFSPRPPVRCGTKHLRTKHLMIRDVSDHLAVSGDLRGALDVLATRPLPASFSISLVGCAYTRLLEIARNEEEPLYRRVRAVESISAGSPVCIAMWEANNDDIDRVFSMDGRHHEDFVEDLIELMSPAFEPPIRYAASETLGREARFIRAREVSRGPIIRILHDLLS